MGELKKSTNVRVVKVANTKNNAVLEQKTTEPSNSIEN